jgi:hypothetical protein
MKTKNITFLSLASLTAALLTGCVVVSVSPFYLEKDLVFEPGLVGHWRQLDDQNEHWNFEKEGTNQYRLTYTTGNETNTMQARLFKLHDQMFLDLFAADMKTEVMPPPIPSHLLLRVLALKPNVQMTALNHGWLRHLLDQQPKALRHEILPTNDKPEDRPVALTAETAELQAFLLKHLHTEEAWKDSFSLKRD